MWLCLYLMFVRATITYTFRVAECVHRELIQIHIHTHIIITVLVLLQQKQQHHQRTHFVTVNERLAIFHFWLAEKKTHLLKMNWTLSGVILVLAKFFPHILPCTLLYFIVYKQSIFRFVSHCFIHAVEFSLFFFGFVRAFGARLSFFFSFLCACQSAYLFAMSFLSLPLLLVFRFFLIRFLLSLLAHDAWMNKQ